MINFFLNRDGMVNIAHYLGIVDLIRSKVSFVIGDKITFI